jgi:hypothetical protein
MSEPPLKIPGAAVKTADQLDRTQFEPRGQPTPAAAVAVSKRGTRAACPARRMYAARDETGADVFHHVERLYNPRRRYSTLGYPNPVEYENAMGSAWGVVIGKGAIPRTLVDRRVPQQSVEPAFPNAWALLLPGRRPDLHG